MIDAVPLEIQHQPPILMEVGRRGSRSRGRSDRSRTDQHDQQPPRRTPTRTRYFTGALAIGVIVLMDGPEGPYECQIVDQAPDETWLCDPSF